MNGVHMEYTAGYRGSQAGACGVHGVITSGLCLILLDLYLNL